jgi:hypothetical protein
MQIILSGVLTFGVPLAFAVSELAGLRRGGGGPARRHVPPAPAPVPPAPGLAPSPKPLPACLIPPERVAARPVRVLEPT